MYRTPRPLCRRRSSAGVGREVARGGIGSGAAEHQSSLNVLRGAPPIIVLPFSSPAGLRLLPQITVAEMDLESGHHAGEALRRSWADKCGSSQFGFRRCDSSAASSMLGMAAISRAIRADAACICVSASDRATAARSDGASGSRSVIPAADCCHAPRRFGLISGKRDEHHGNPWVSPARTVPLRAWQTRAADYGKISR
jgi:hypothetical protein